MATVSTLEVLITADATLLKATYAQATAATKQFQAATASSSAATKEASATSKLFGQATTLAFTAAKLGVLAFAAVSVKAAYDFNRQFTQIAAITNTAASQIGALKDTVIGLSQQTAVAPVELAHALYFLASAGLTSQQQMEALDASAKGTAIGLGDSGDLARISANALNAFSDQGLRASQVMDTLVAAVREGTAEPNEFASALGRVLPIADQAGISFQSVAASLATMSNAGLDVNEGVTALRAILQSLVAPTAQTESAFNSMGLTVDQVVQSMQQQGLIATLRLVSDSAKKATSSTGEYNQMMRHAIPNIRGLAGALNLLKQDSGKVDEIFQQVKNSTGDMATAFQITTQSAAFKLKQAFNDILIAGQQIATVVLPPIAAALSAILPPIAAILPYAVELGIAWAAWVAVPPVLSAVAVAILVAKGGVVALTEAVLTMNVTALGPWIAIAGIAVVTLGALTGNFKVAAIAAGVVVIQIGLLGNAFTEAQIKMGAFGLAMVAVTEAWKALQGLNAQKNAAAGGFAGTIESQNASLEDFNQSMETALGQRKSFFGQALDLFSGSPNVRGYMAYDQAVQQVISDIQAQNNDITQGTDIMATYGGILNNTSTTSMQLHGALATVLTDYYKQNDGLRGLNTVQLNTLVTAGKWHAAINLVSDALERSNAEIAKQAKAQQDLGRSVVASDFAKLAPFIDSLGMSFGQFQQAASAAFNGSKEDADKFISDMTAKWTDAWNQFKSTAFTALDFTSKALADLGTAATSAQQQLAGDTSSMSTAALADLGNQANITSSEIISSFKAAAAQTRNFGNDLLDIAKVGGAAGKALASSLLQSGNTAAAATIANSPMEKQIVALYGKNYDLANTLSTKLTDSIVGPLDKIVSLLSQLARHWGLTVDAHTGKANKGVDDLKGKVDKFTNANHVVKTYVQDNASGKIKTIQGDVDHLVGGAHQIYLGVTADVAKQQLHNFDSTLDTFLNKKRTVVIGVHTEPKSPWPDEALKTHLVDPMRAAGFKKVGDSWTLPLSVGAHSDMTGPGGGGNNSGLGALKEIERRQLNVLFDIRKELKSANVMHKSNGGTSYSGSTGGSGGGGNVGGIHGELSGLGHNGQKYKEFMADALAYATHNVPRLPRGHTHISVNHHEGRRRREVVLDRKRFTDTASYDIDYARGF